MEPVQGCLAFEGETAFISSQPAALPAVVSRFLDHCRLGKRLSAHTLRAYQVDLRDFAHHLNGEVGIEDVEREHVREYIRVLSDERRLKATSIRRRIATLKILFRWMEQEAVVPLSVFHRLNISIRLPRRLPRALSSDEIRRLLKRADAEAGRKGPTTYDCHLLHFVVMTLLTTGLRIGELVATQLGDVSLPDATIQVRGKGNRERRVYLSGRQATSVMSRFLRARKCLATTSDRLLADSEGQEVTAQQLRRSLRELALRAGVSRRVTPHMLRHTAATQLIEAGVDIRLVQRLLGHANIGTTQIYTQVTDTTLRTRLAKANVLGRLQRAG